MAGAFGGKVVMITGGAGAVGQIIAETFAADGAKLVLMDHSREKLENVVSQLTANRHLDTHILPGDATDPAAVDAMIAEVEAKFGRIDVLAHTIGGFAFGDPVTAMDFSTVDKMFNLNVRPIYTLVGRVARHMLDHQVRGKIVVVLARAALKGAANSSAYNASKAAAQSIMESLSLEVRDAGINVNGVLPSIIDTPANRSAMGDANAEKWVTREDIAQAIYYLASDAAKSLHGVSLEVYGRV